MADLWLDRMIEEIRAKELELINLKKAANTFFRAKELPPPFADTEPESVGGSLKFKADEFYGKGFATAVRIYLERRKESSTAEDIHRVLEQGGFDFDAIGWKEENRTRTVAMSLAKNTAIFHRLPSGTFGLKEWYPEAIERKAKSKKSEVVAEEEEEDEAASE